jgi:hypothetical protein
VTFGAVRWNATMTMNIKKIDVFTKEEITALVAEQHKALDDGLELIGERLGKKGETPWDLVGVDSEKRLVLIQVEALAADRILSALLSRLDWAWEHLETIARMYPDHGIDCSRLPRVLVIAPEFSPALKRSMSYLTYRVSISLYAYRYLQTDAGKGLLLELLLRGAKYDRVPKNESVKVRVLEVPAPAKVTTEEIMEFLQEGTG